jgi:hypothetical protein
MIFFNFYSKYIDLNYSKYIKKNEYWNFVKFEIDICFKRKIIMKRFLVNYMIEKILRRLFFFSIFLIDNYLYFFNYRKKIFIDLWKK